MISNAKTAQNHAPLDVEILKIAVYAQIQDALNAETSTRSLVRSALMGSNLKIMNADLARMKSFSIKRTKHAVIVQVSAQTVSVSQSACHAKKTVN
jgi:hypothetical protein